jgi:hypothetical protein
MQAGTQARRHAGRQADSDGETERVRERERERERKMQTDSKIAMENQKHVDI